MKIDRRIAVLVMACAGSGAIGFASGWASNDSCTGDGLAQCKKELAGLKANDEALFMMLRINTKAIEDLTEASRAWCRKDGPR